MSHLSSASADKPATSDLSKVVSALRTAPAPLILGHALPGGLRGPGRGEEAGGFEGEVLERDGGVHGHGVRHQAHAALLRGVHTQGLGQSSSHGLAVMGACLDDSDQEHYVMS